MELIIMFASAIVVVLIAGIAILGGLSQRLKSRKNEFQEQISQLEGRVAELEKRDE